MKTTAQNFLELLKLNGHNGDSMCLATIEEKLSHGVAVAVSHYSKYLSKVTVKKLSAAEVTKLVKSGAKVWTAQGIISKSKFNVPELNGVLLLNENIEKLVKTPVVIL